MWTGRTQNLLASYPSVVTSTYCYVLLCVCVHSAWKGRPRNDLYCIGWDIKPYSVLTLSPVVILTWVTWHCELEPGWGLRKPRSALPYGPLWLWNEFMFFLCVCCSRQPSAQFSVLRAMSAEARCSRRPLLVLVLRRGATTVSSASALYAQERRRHQRPWQHQQWRWVTSYAPFCPLRRPSLRPSSRQVNCLCFLAWFLFNLQCGAGQLCAAS